MDRTHRTHRPPFEKCSPFRLHSLRIELDDFARIELSQSDRKLLTEPSELEQLHLLTFLQDPESIADNFACRVPSVFGQQPLGGFVVLCFFAFAGTLDREKLPGRALWLQRAPRLAEHRRTMKRIVAVVTLIPWCGRPGRAAAADTPKVVELWPGKVPDETGTIGPETGRMSPKHTRNESEVTEPTDW